MGFSSPLPYMDQLAMGTRLRKARSWKECMHCHGAIQVGEQYREIGNTKLFLHPSCWVSYLEWLQLEREKLYGVEVDLVSFIKQVKELEGV